jgi:hypothetical protein
MKQFHTYYKNGPLKSKSLYQLLAHPRVDVFCVAGVPFYYLISLCRLKI